MDFYASYLAGGVNNMYMWDKELGAMPIGRPVLRRQNAEMGRNKKEMPPIDPYAIYLARGVTSIPLNAVRHCKLQDNFDEEKSIDEARKVWNTVNEKKLRNEALQRIQTLPRVNYSITYDTNVLTESRLAWQKSRIDRITTCLAKKSKGTKHTKLTHKSSSY